MATKTWKGNIFFILDEPTEPGNIGASARALKNMGFSRLELVNPVDFLNEEAKSMACQAKDFLKKAKVISTFHEAIADKQLVVGTTRRVGSRRGLILPLREGAKRIVKAAGKNKVGILFGNEHNGLTNEEVEECGFLMTIPASAAFPSLNLAQSVMLVAYELGQPSLQSDWPKLVRNKDLRKLYPRIQATLRLLEYSPQGDRNLQSEIMRNLKRLIGRAGLTEWELGMLYGLCRQVEKKLMQRDAAKKTA